MTQRLRSISRMRSVLAGSVLAAMVPVGACSRQERRLSEPGSFTSRSTYLERGELVKNPERRFVSNAWSLAEGQRYFESFNCSGCHGGAGGGGIGPALSDGSWRYGGTVADIHASIAFGRPNGMPTFAERIPDYVIWQLASYVVSLSGRAPLDVAPGRSDSISSGPPPAMKPAIFPEPLAEVPR